MKSAFTHSFRHRDRVLSGVLCGCYYCQSIYLPIEVTEWTDEDESGVGQTALCPKCGIDAVLSSCDYEINAALLAKWHKAGFGD